MVEQITFYTAKLSPYCLRVEIALLEAGAEFILCPVDLHNKPSWFVETVNPVGKVPTIAYGTQAAPDSPSPDSFKLAESLVILEFIAELFPESNLLPKDPVGRAKTRFFVNAADTRFTFRAQSDEELDKSLEYMQSLLPSDAKYAIGDEFTIADAAFAPALAFFDIILRLKSFTPEGKKRQEIANKYEKLWKYLDRVKERECFQKAYAEEYYIGMLKKRFGIQSA